ncbi:MAG: hypothetical protein Q3985_04135 [Eubacteriales bacterium]|nr:hypothetical protein [Eubacteriales bacterium]
MLKALIKKQYQECFRTYFVNVKTGKARSKAGMAGMFVLFAVLMLFLCGAFFGMAFLLGDLITAGLPWLYYALMGMVSIALGTFGSVFNTFSTLYLAKDNELLLSMPIPSSKILTTRMTLVYGLSLLYSGVVWLPAIVYSWIFSSPSVLSVIFGILLLFIIALFVTVLTCVLGWVVALVAVRVKKKSFVTVVLSLVFFALYYFVCFRMSDFMTALVNNSEAVSQGVKTWGNFLYQLGQAANGGIVGMVIFTGITLALFALCFYVLSKSFTRIVTKTPATSKVTAKATAAKAQDVKSALFKRELKRFTSSATYMLNCGLGIVILPILAVVALVKRAGLQDALTMFADMVPGITPLVPFIMLAAVCMIIAINGISTPSISLEGKNLWILRTMPVSGRDVLEAKLNLHVVLNSIPAVITTAILGWCVDADIATIALMAVFSWVFVWFTGAFGLILGLKRPNFNWTVESMPIKQSLNVLLSYLMGWVLVIVVCAGAYLLRNTFSAQTYLALAVAVVAIGARFLKNWLNTKGDALFNAL